MIKQTMCYVTTNMFIIGRLIRNYLIVRIGPLWGYYVTDKK